MEEILRVQNIGPGSGLPIYVGKSMLPKIQDVDRPVAKRVGKGQALIVATDQYAQVIVNNGKGYPPGGIFLDRLEATLTKSGFTVGKLPERHSSGLGNHQHTLKMGSLSLFEAFKVIRKCLTYHSIKH